MISVGIMGATGYVGSELLRLIKAHPNLDLKLITSQSYVGKEYGDIFQNYRHEQNLVCQDIELPEAAEQCDAVFIALPHGIASQKVTKDILNKTTVIDLGADFRLKDKKVYENWYATEHFGPELLEKAVYGLCEINREDIKSTKLVANPGCYTTCSILALYPLFKEGLIEPDSVCIDAKSGVSGAGRGVSLDVHFNEVNESIKAYKIASHRHTPEIEEQLSYAAGEEIILNFTPHLVPMNRGILSTCYAKLKPMYKNTSYSDIQNVYKKYYDDEYFIRLCKENTFPETRWVKGSNFCDIGFTLDKRTGRIIVVSALDNLLKGAAGQAVQNLNICLGLDEKTGLEGLPVFPS